MCQKLRFQATICAALGLVVLLIPGCPNIIPGPGGSSGPARLVPFQSPQELLNYFKEQATARVNLGAQRGSGLALFDALGGAAPTAGGEQGGTEDAADTSAFSTTNVQEVGVDESDVFKSDGTYFYIAKDQSLRILRANPPDQMAEVGRLDLDFRVDELYLAGSTVIALSTRYGAYGPGQPEILIWPPYYQASTSTIGQVDVSDPAHPALTGQVELDGSLVSSRLLNGRLIAVLTIMPELPTEANAVSIGRMGLDDVMPHMQRAGGAGVSEELVPWDHWLHPESPDGYFMTAVVTLDAADVETVVESVAILANAGTIYASTEALYLTDAEYDPQDNFREKTAIHKFDFDDDGAAQYVASGSVPGRLLNQFSLGEYEGYLRVASHVSSTGWFGDFGIGPDGVAVAVAETAKPSAEQAAADETAPPPDFDTDPPYNAVYVLGQTGAELTVAGLVDGIAPNEQIYSARFMGTRGFLVTFRRFDPLWVLDLSDPQNPQVMGDLEIPGYSEYLHPLGDSHLIGVGRAVEFVEPWGIDEPGAVQLSLFDVSNWSAPQLVQQITLGGAHSYCEISQTHKAFTLVERNGQTLLALPARLTPEGTSWVEWVNPEFFGVVCFQVDPATGFTELGRVTALEDQYDWWSSWCRAAFIGDALYAITSDGVRTSALPEFAVTREVQLAQ